MAKTTKGVRLDDELLEWFEEQENGSEATRQAIKMYMELQENFDTGIEFHLGRALKLYKQYLNKIDNLEFSSPPRGQNNDQAREDISLSDNSKQEEIDVGDLEENLDNL